MKRQPGGCDQRPAHELGAAGRALASAGSSADSATVPDEAAEGAPLLVGAGAGVVVVVEVEVEVVVVVVVVEVVELLGGGLAVVVVVVEVVVEVLVEVLVGVGVELAPLGLGFVAVGALLALVGFSAPLGRPVVCLACGEVLEACGLLGPTSCGRTVGGCCWPMERAFATTGAGVLVVLVVVVVVVVVVEVELICCGLGVQGLMQTRRSEM